MVLVKEFQRLELLIGDKIKDINKKCVLIIGLGGVGGNALESLIRSGVQNFILVDNDIIDITNLNRQIISNQNNIGLYKVDEWEKRAYLINKNIKIKKIKEFITEDNINILFEEKIDYLIDACDTIGTKKAIIKKCLEKKIKFISCMGTGNKFHPEYLEITDIRKTSYDKIAKIIRKMVNDEHIKGKIPVLYSKEMPKKTGSRTVGSNAFAPSVAGILCASYIFNLMIEEKNEKNS